MSVKIKISYTDPEELKKILNILKPFLICYNVSKNTKGNYRKAYAELNFGGAKDDKRTHS